MHKTVRVLETPKYLRDVKHLNQRQIDESLRALTRLKFALSTGQHIPGLRMKALQNFPGVLELSCSGSIRLTFTYAPPSEPDEVVVRLLRVGDHEILKQAQL
jgi:hypothetical protein